MEIPLADTIFDVVVLGGGPAGYTCAIRASQYGLKAALIDANDRLGGTCLLWGCIPTKAMLFSAELWDHLKHADRYGIDVVTPKLNWKGVLARKDDVIGRHVKGLDFLMKKNKINAIKGYGRLTGPAKDGVHTIEACRAIQGFERGVDEEAIALLFDHGQAAAGHCYRIADADVVEPEFSGIDDEAFSSLQGGGFDNAADGSDDSGKHTEPISP